MLFIVAWYSDDVCSNHLHFLRGDPQSMYGFVLIFDSCLPSAGFESFQKNKDEHSCHSRSQNNCFLVILLLGGDGVRTGRIQCAIGCRR